MPYLSSGLGPVIFSNLALCSPLTNSNRIDAILRQADLEKVHETSTKLLSTLGRFVHSQLQ
jgi:hypothetical protein